MQILQISEAGLAISVSKLKADGEAKLFLVCFELDVFSNTSAVLSGYCPCLLCVAALPRSGAVRAQLLALGMRSGESMCCLLCPSKSLTDKLLICCLWILQESVSDRSC